MKCVMIQSSTYDRLNTTLDNICKYMYTLKYGSSSSVTFHMVFFVSIPTQIILTNTSTLCQLIRLFFVLGRMFYFKIFPNY